LYVDRAEVTETVIDMYGGKNELVPLEWVHEDGGWHLDDCPSVAS
jgi:hypothetical protein